MMHGGIDRIAHRVHGTLGNLTFEAEMSLQGTVVGPRGAPRTCTLGRGTHPTHSIDLGGRGGLRATLPPDSAPISSTLDLPFPVWEVCESAWTQSPLRGSAQHVSKLWGWEMGTNMLPCRGMHWRCCLSAATRENLCPNQQNHGICGQKRLPCGPSEGHPEVQPTYS